MPIAASSDRIAWADWYASYGGQVGTFGADRSYVPVGNSVTPWAITFVGEAVVWTEVDAGTVIRGNPGYTHDLMLSEPTHMYDLVSDGVAMFVSSADDDGNGALYRIDDVDTHAVLYPLHGPPSWLALRNGDLYFSNEGGTILRGSTGGAPTQVLASVPGTIGALTADDDYVYLSFVEDDGSGKLERVPRGGGSVEVLSDVGRPTAIAVDDDAVYWLDYADQGQSEAHRRVKTY